MLWEGLRDGDSARICRSLGDEMGAYLRGRKEVETSALQLQGANSANTYELGRGPRAPERNGAPQTP